MSSAVAEGKPETDLNVPPKAITWPLRTATADDSRGTGAGKESSERHDNSSREGFTAVAGDAVEASEGSRFAATGVVTREAKGFEDAARASSTLGRLASVVSAICCAGLFRALDSMQYLVSNRANGK